MDLQKVKDILHIVCLVLLTFCLSVTAIHLTGWVRALDASFVHFDKLMGEGSIAMKNVAASSKSTKESADTVNKELPTLVNQMHGSLTKFNTLLDSSDVAMHSANSLIITGSKAIQDSSLDVRHIAENTDLLTNSATKALDSIPPSLESFQRLMGSASLFIDKPLTDTMHNVDGVLVPSGLMVSDFQKKEHEFFWPEPYTGKHPFWHKTKGFLWAAPHFAQPAYYGIRIIKGE